MLPLISVILPVYNCQKYINEAIESVKAQNYPELEIIAVDDGSTDNSANILKKYDFIKYIYQPNSGPASARNNGIKNSSGEIIAFIDSDDLWPEDKIELQYSEFRKNKSLEVVMGRIKYVELHGALNRNMKRLDSENTFKYVNLGAGLFRKSVFQKVGYFDENFIFWEDLDWFLKAYETEIRIKFSEYTTLIYRVHSENMSNDTEEGNHFFRKALRNSINRKRNRTKRKFTKILDDIE